VSAPGGAPRFSVVLPTHERPDRLRRAVRSVLDQAFGDFELLIVDDASADGTPEVTAGFDDPRVRAFRNPTNRGAAASRNRALGEARGELIAILDDDDAVLPGLQEAFDRAFAGAPPETGFGWCGARVVAETPDGPQVRLEAVWSPEVANREEAHRLFLTRRMIGTNGGLVVRRELLEREGGFDEAFPCAEDTDLLVRLSRAAEFLVVPEILIEIREHAGDRMTVYGADMARAYDMLAAKHRETLRRHPDLRFEILYKTSWLYYHGGDRRRARARWLEAVRARPLRPRAWAALSLFELLGSRAPLVHRAAARWKRRLLRPFDR
jgi:glycosyltransferase involved in cell wall biosynthesis